MNIADSLLLCITVNTLYLPPSLSCGLYLTTLAWAGITYFNNKPTEEEKEERKTRLAEATKINPNLSVSWYDSVSVRCKIYEYIRSIALITSCISVIYLCFPMSFTDWYTQNIAAVEGKIPSLQPYFATILFGVHFVPFWFISVFTYLLDLVNRNSLFKIQEGKTLGLCKFMECSLLSLLNQGISLLLLTVVPYDADLVFAPKLPPASVIITSMGTFAIVSEIWFYSWHRLMHKYDFLYNNFHAIHHQITFPTPVSSLYAHPLEHILLNFPTLCLGPLLTQSHFVLWVAWSLFATVSTCQAHSGWHLPFMGSPEQHDFHHSYGSENFGIAIGVMDDVFHSRKIWNKSVNKKVDKKYTTPDYPVDKTLLSQCI